MCVSCRDDNPDSLKPHPFQLHPRPQISSLLRTKGTEIVGQQNPKFIQITHTCTQAQWSLWVRQRLPIRSGRQKVQGSPPKQGSGAPSQLRCTLSCIVLTSLISISCQHIQPSPAMNQNLEGSVLRAQKQPLIKLLWMRGRAGCAGRFPESGGRRHPEGADR